MQQRRLRLGDILDDYCPRERRITNHAVVAMIDDQVKQTRCTTCDADHEYKQAKVPLARRKKADGSLADSPEGALRTRPAIDDPAPLDADETEDPDIAAAEPLEADAAAVGNADPEEEPLAAGSDDDGPVHRRLIRATLPRPEGQVPERKATDFTIRQPGGRGGREFEGNKNGHRGGRRPLRAPGAAGPGQPPRFGGPRQGPGPGQGGPPRHGSGQGQRPPGNRSGPPGGQRGGGRSGPGPGPGQGQGQGQGQGRGGGGRKRGR